MKYKHKVCEIYYCKDDKRIDDEIVIDNLEREGWELITVVPIISLGMTYLRLYFKKEV